MAAGPGFENHCNPKPTPAQPQRQRPVNHKTSCGCKVANKARWQCCFPGAQFWVPRTIPKPALAKSSSMVFMGPTSSICMARRWFSGLFSGSNRWILELCAPSDTAGLDGPSGAHQTSGESLGAEIIRERTLEMTTHMVLTRAGAQDASAAALAHQGRSQESPGSST